MKTIQGRESVFSDFVDPFDKIVPAELHKWINAQKLRTERELI
jgi:hypothetical protein